jgi:hypothetical protein
MSIRIAKPIYQLIGPVKPCCGFFFRTWTDSPKVLKRPCPSGLQRQLALCFENLVRPRSATQPGQQGMFLFPLATVPLVLPAKSVCKSFEQAPRGDSRDQKA